MGIHWKELINPDYLGAYSLWDEKQSKFIEKVVQIKSIANGEFIGGDGKKKVKPIAQIKGEKPMILNNTNLAILQKAFRTPDISFWLNKDIILTTEKIDAFGKVGVDVLRIHPKLPKLPDLNPEHPRWNGAKLAIKEGNTTIEKIKETFSLTKRNEILLCK